MHSKFILLISLILIFGCDKDGETTYSIIPHIKFVNVQFEANSATSQLHELKITFSYKDEDGDIGFDYVDPRYLTYPYQERFYFSKLDGEEISSDKVDRGEISVESLISYNDRSTPPYDTLPELNCSNYYRFSQDIVLYQVQNYNHYNLLVDFFVEDQEGVFKKV